MGDTKIVYDEKFGIATFKRKICAELGETFWNELIKNIELVDIDSECKCQCHNMYLFMKRLGKMTDEVLAFIKENSEMLAPVRNFAEAFMDRELEGKVVCSVLKGDLTCEYEIEIPMISCKNM